MYYEEKLEVEKTNELREQMSRLNNFTVILDEVHHAYKSGKDEKKLRIAVNILNKNNNINNVIGLSGTPYVKNTIKAQGFEIKLKQIQDIVYDYPLNRGISAFLKDPIIKKSAVKESSFIENALNDFFKDFDIVYRNGTKSKIAFYCPSIEKLNWEILPIVKKWYRKNRPNKESEIFKYYSNISKNKEEYKLPKDSLAVFHNLDKPYCQKRVILLVAVGTEGWDCKSLTAVALPRKETAKNFVLQTSCRCLREVNDAKEEKALIYLCPANYEKLDNELRENYDLTIKDLQTNGEKSIDIQIRKPNLGRLKYRQIKFDYKIESKTKAKPKDSLKTFTLDYYKNKYPYQTDITTGKIGRQGIVYQVNQSQTGHLYSKPNITLEDLIYKIADNLYGLYTESSIMNFETEIKVILDALNENLGWIYNNPRETLFDEIISDIASLFADSIKFSRAVKTREVEQELLDWQTPDKIYIDNEQDILMPDICDDLKNYIKHPEDLEKDFFEDSNNIDPNNASFNYIPYPLDSNYEKNALVEMLKIPELADLELYFNGYKNAKLESFYIDTPYGIYTPDFLILKREQSKKYKNGQKGGIDKILILETKGAPYYETFKTKEKFIAEHFIKHNPIFSFHCFVDNDGKNDFSKHLNELKDILKNF